MMNNLPAPLTKEEFFAYFKKFKEGDFEARDKLIEHNLRLVVSRVHSRFANTAYEKEDLEAIGVAGLIKAVDTFDENKKKNFSTYAVICIDNEILMYIRNNKKHLANVSLNQAISKDDDDKERVLEDILCDEEDFTLKFANIQDLREALEILPPRDKEIVKFYFGFYDDRSYTQQEVGEKFGLERTSIASIIRKSVKKLKNYIEHGTSATQSSALKFANIQDLREELEILPPRDKEIVKLYFGFYDDRSYTQQEIGEKFGLTKAAISLIIKKSVEKLKNYVETGRLVVIPEEEKSETNKMPEGSTSIKGKDNMPRKIRTIYEILNCTKEEFETLVYPKLLEKEKDLLFRKYGEDFDNPVTISDWSNIDNRNFFNLVTPMKGMLTNPNYRRRNRKKRKKEEKIVSSEVNSGKIETESIVPTPFNPINNSANGIIKLFEIYGNTSSLNDSVISKEDCVKVLTLLKIPAFTEMMEMVSPKEAIICALKMGYIDGKIFSTESIASFLDISEEEIRNTVRNVLIFYKESMCKLIDKAILIVTDQDKNIKERKK